MQYWWSCTAMLEQVSSMMRQFELWATCRNNVIDNGIEEFDPPDDPEIEWQDG